MWRKAPFVLVRYPGLFAALAVGALLLTLAAVSYPLFISATAGTLVEAEINEALVTRYGAGVTYRADHASLELTAPDGQGGSAPAHEMRDALFRREMARSAYLGEPVATALGDNVSVSAVDGSGQFRIGKLFAGQDFLKHVRVIEGRDGDGVWLPDLIADALRLGPGDRIELRGDGVSVGTTVDGVYEALYSRPQAGYWLKWYDDIYSDCTDCSPPPQFVLVDHDQFLSLSRALGVETASFVWTAPLAPGARLTLDDARELERFVEDFRTDIRDNGSLLGRVFDCCQVFAIFRRTGSQLFSFVGTVVDAVEERLAAVEAPGLVLQVAGIVVSLGVLAAAGIFAHSARRVEAGLLFARGVSASAVGLKAGVEAVIPALLGGIAGFGLALLLVRTVGPSGPLSTGAFASAAWGGALAVGGALGAIGGVSAATFIMEHHRARLGVLARVPWEAVLLAVALLCFRQFGSGGALVSDPGMDIRRPSPFLLLFPIAFIGGFAAVAARMLRLGFRRLREGDWGVPHPAYLAVHRVAAAPGLILALVAAVGMSVGTFVQARMLERSLEATVQAKARVFVGSDVQAWVAPQTTVPEDFPLPVTRVIRLAHAGQARPGGSFDLLAIDPATLPRAAFWREGFSDRSLNELVEAVATPEGASLAIVLAGAEGPGPTTLDIHERRLPVRVVARPEAFPGMLAGRPLVVADAEAISEAFADSAAPLEGSNARTELWVRGDPRRAVEALFSLDDEPFGIVTAEQVEDIPYIAAVVDTFVVLNALGLGTGVLVIAALLMYLEARQRSQAVALGLSLRMGMTPGGHRRSLALELGSMMLVSFVAAVVLAVTAVLVMVPHLDPLPRIPPNLLLVAPAASIAVAFVVLAAVAWAGAWVAERRARAIPLGEVMRVAE